MKKYRNLLIGIALALCVFGESMAYTYIQYDGSNFYYTSSLLYFITGIFICLLPLFSTNGTKLYSGYGLNIRKYLPFVFVCFLSGMFLFHVVMLSAMYKACPVDKMLADMLPVIRLSCERLLHRQPVYAPTNEIWPNSVNAYLPMMWLPYLPAVVFNYDLRWTTVVMLFAALFVAAIPVYKNSKGLSPTVFLITGVSLFLVLNFFMTQYCDFWRLTEEGGIAGFYILLGFALLQRRFYLTGFSIAMCVLSRYSLAPWIPVYFAFIYFTEPFENFKKMIIVFFGILLVVFILPFFIWDPLYFLKLPFVQGGSSSQAWFWNNYNIGVDKSLTTVGLYKFFTRGNSHFMLAIELFTSVAFPVLLIWLALKKNLNKRFLGFSSLKLSLVFFYNFIPVPYGYLFFPATMISYVLMFDYMSKQIQIVEKEQ